jgi:hypothetical protein
MIHWFESPIRGAPASRWGPSSPVRSRGSYISPETIVFTPTGSFTTPGTVTAYRPLNAGPNTVEFFDASAYPPDFNGITLSR